MFRLHPIRNIKTHLKYNTDITYLETKEKSLKDLTEIKKRIIEIACELDERLKMEHQILKSTLSAPFEPINMSNYNNELKNHFALMKKLEQDFDTLLASLLDTIIKEQSNRTISLTNALAIENLKIKECKDKYSEATNLIFVSSGYELLREQLLAEQALLAFQSSKEYLEVLGRSRAESNLMKR